MKSFAAHVARPGRSRNTVRLALAPLRAMLADAAEAGDIRQNPARGVRIGNLTKSPAAAPVKALKPSEAATLIAALLDPYRLLVRFLLETGLRISEVAALRWSDVDFAAHRVRVERRYRDGRLGPPKSNAGRRVVPLPATDIPIALGSPENGSERVRRGAGIPREERSQLPRRDQRRPMVRGRRGEGASPVGDAAHLPTHLRELAARTTAHDHGGTGMARTRERCDHARVLRAFRAGRAARQSIWGRFGDDARRNQPRRAAVEQRRTRPFAGDFELARDEPRRPATT